MINNIPADVSTGSIYTFGSDSDEKFNAFWLFWDEWAYSSTFFTVTFTGWGGLGGNAVGTFSADVYNAFTGETLLVTEGSFCAPINAAP